MMENNNQKFFMDIAIEEAKIAGLNGEVPIGAVTVMNNEVIAKSGNKMQNLNNPLMHAEIIVLNETSEFLINKGISIRHAKVDLFTTLEPCTMCAYAISLCRIRNLYYAADDPKGGGVSFGSKVFEQDTCHHKPNIHRGLNRKISEGLLKEFFKVLRKK